MMSPNLLYGYFFLIVIIYYLLLCLFLAQCCLVLPPLEKQLMQTSSIGDKLLVPLSERNKASRHECLEECGSKKQSSAKENNCIRLEDHFPEHVQECSFHSDSFGIPPYFNSAAGWTTQPFALRDVSFCWRTEQCRRKSTFTRSTLYVNVCLYTQKPEDILQQPYKSTHIIFLLS